MKASQSIISRILTLSAALLLQACNASDSVSHYESNDSASGPRIDKEQQQAPPLPDTFQAPADTARDSISRRSIAPPGTTDTSKLNMQ
ncbi:hypothetical protein [Taibaiella koreensis]|uniref:hypothetical protein n=1 Tax=Taibaiella koreensis TaxID=1268548 RepID=UPI000E59CDF9|nr:hypothetical protein [Taibaiella koreensis]